MLQSQAIRLPVSQTNRNFASELPPPHPNSQAPNNVMPYLGGRQAALSLSYTSVSQSNVTSVSCEGQIMPLQQAGARPAVTTSIALETSVRPPPAGVTAAEWREHTSADGRRMLFFSDFLADNMRTSLSTWEKPFGLMTPMEVSHATSFSWCPFCTLIIFHIYTEEL
ncbi:hypothetical protein DVH24_034416 [Malus domestica]|uniref:Uncharacterized protein n=1 Tax=Malus domestica TaxID=3750 RepID=A0A498IWC3_MALDO|nr:hypothetical protein DVH24_034416 [Malus domestica]